MALTWRVAGLALSVHDSTATTRVLHPRAGGNPEQADHQSPAQTQQVLRGIKSSPGHDAPGLRRFASDFAQQPARAASALLLHWLCSARYWHELCPFAMGY
eukprot:964763-Rhodomonas_salina.3